MRLVIWIALLLGLAGAAQAQTRPLDGPGRRCSDGLYGPVQCLRAQHHPFDLCQMLEQTARHHFLDPGFLARLIWQDSRFELGRISAAKLVAEPQLNSDKPGLGDVSEHLNPAQIVERTGRYIAYLKQEDGNIGLAAMAYDAGERGAFGFMAGNVALRQRSVEFVKLVTGISAERWRNDPPDSHDFSLSPELDFMNACIALAHGRALHPPGTKLDPWGVQLGKIYPMNRAKLEHARRVRSCPQISAQKVDYVAQQHRFAGRRALWMARIAQTGRDAALALCAEIRQSGCACRVVSTR